MAKKDKAAAQTAPPKPPAKSQSAGQQSKSTNGSTQRSQKSRSENGAAQRSQSSESKTGSTQRSQSRTASGQIPRGRTLTTNDKFLDKKAKDPEKERPVVVIEVNSCDELAVVQLTTTEGKDRTRLPKYQQGQSLFKHYVEIEDSDGEPIKVNGKFRENHPNMDVSMQDVSNITDTVLNHSKPMQKNRERINKFRGKKG